MPLSIWVQKEKKPDSITFKTYNTSQKICHSRSREK